MKVIMALFLIIFFIVLGIPLTVIGLIIWLMPEDKIIDLVEGLDGHSFSNDPHEVFRRIGLIVHEMRCDRIHYDDAFSLIDQLSEHGMEITPPLLTND